MVTTTQSIISASLAGAGFQGFNPLSTITDLKKIQDILPENNPKRPIIEPMLADVNTSKQDIIDLNFHVAKFEESYQKNLTDDDMGNGQPLTYNKTATNTQTVYAEEPVVQTLNYSVMLESAINVKGIGSSKNLFITQLV